MKRYKDLHIEEYKEVNISSELISWDSLSMDTRKDIVQRLRENGWFSFSTLDDHSSNTEKEMVINILICLHTMKSTYLSFKAPIPPHYDNYFGSLYLNQVDEAIDTIFTELEDLPFYDFISLYVNTLDSVLQEFFIKNINNFFQQLGVNKTINSEHILPRQSIEIQKRIIEPTFELLKGDDFSKINKELQDGLDAHRKQSFGLFIQCSINALVSTLEYISKGEITKKQKPFKGMIEKLLEEGTITKEIAKILKEINSYAEIERMEKTKAHTSDKQPTEQEALFIFNLTMSVIQFLILSKSTK